MADLGSNLPFEVTIGYDRFSLVPRWALLDCQRWALSTGTGQVARWHSRRLALRSLPGLHQHAGHIIVLRRSADEHVEIAHHAAE